MALQTKSISDVGAKGHHKFTLTVTEESTSTADNTSSISWKLVLSPKVSGYDWYYSSTVPVTYKVTIAGTTYSGNIMNYNGTGTVTVRSGTKTVAHNADGSKSISFSFSVSSLNVSYLPGAASASGSMTLTSIARKATITSAPNFNDEGNPTINYSNKAGNAVSSLRACISLTGANADIEYRDIPKTGTSYTFNLTDAEREVLRKATTGSNSRSVRFYIRTVIDGTTYSSYVSKTFSVINGTPTIAPTVTDTNATTVALTGDANKLIKYYSDVSVAVNATAKKSATISSYKITNGSKTLTSKSGTFNDIESGSFVFSATDSRKNTVSQTITKTVINYVPLTCKVTADAMNALGELTFKVSGNAFNGSFGAASNSLTVYYRMKENEGAWSGWTAVTPTLSGNTYSATVTKTGLNYQSKYELQAKAVDSLATKESAEMAIKSAPVFDWSQTDFNTNVPLNMNGKTVLRENNENGHTVLSSNGGDVFIRPNGTNSSTAQSRFYADGTVVLGGKTYGANTLLWSGTSYMGVVNGEAQENTFSKSIADMPHGAVFVFSGYDTANGKAVNENFHSFFIPKGKLANHNGYGHNFALFRGGKFFQKYIYIYTTRIIGHSMNNNSSYSLHGQTVNNCNFVLREVWGV